MGLRKSTGNMYPWVTHTHAALGGECPHKCTYCYVNNPRFGRPAKYCGPLRLIEEEMKTNLGKGRTIFKENCNDLFANDVPEEFIKAILAHCCQYPRNVYVFQTKNPGRMKEFIPQMPPRSILGVTIETNCDLSNISKAPSPTERFKQIEDIRGKYPKQKIFITIEPIIDFYEGEFEWRICASKVNWINIGADSKNHGLNEPSPEKIQKLISKLMKRGIAIREKHNLNRLLGK